MIYATKIKMKNGCEKSNNLLEIDKIYLSGVVQEGFYYKSEIYDFLKSNPNSKIKVNINPYPELQPVVSKNGEKYVRSIANLIYIDNLLCLPRE